MLADALTDCVETRRFSSILAICHLLTKSSLEPKLKMTRPLSYIAIADSISVTTLHHEAALGIEQMHLASHLIIHRTSNIKGSNKCSGTHSLHEV